jgi:hypothetical protein
MKVKVKGSGNRVNVSERERTPSESTRFYVKRYERCVKHLDVRVNVYETFGCLSERV